MAIYTDQMNSTIRLGIPIAIGTIRIVSLVPSQTELLHYLGLEEEVVGITKFCIHPKSWFDSKTRIGGTKSVDIEKVRTLKPDLIIGNKEENTKEDIDALREIAPVWMSDISTLDDAIEMLQLLGEILNKKVEIDQLVFEIRSEFDALRKFSSTHPTLPKKKSNALKVNEGSPTAKLNGKTVLYFIWNEPPFLAGKDTFIDAMLNACGLVNATSVVRYPQADPSIQPDFVFLSSEPFPFEEKHIEKFRDVYPTSKIILVDGEQFSWYGSRLKIAPKYFQSLLESLVN